MAAATTPSSTGISSPSDSLIITSPTLSASSLSSSGFDFVTVRQHLGLDRFTPTAVAPINAAPPPAPADTGAYGKGSFSDSDDDIIWGVSESSDSEESRGAVFSDDDFVVLGRQRSPTSKQEPLAKAEATTSSTDTIRSIPPIIPFGSDSILDEGRMDQESASTQAAEAAEAGTSELATWLARLGVGPQPLGEAGGAKASVNSAPSSPASKKKGKEKKKRTPEEEEARVQRRKERKERRRREKKAAKALEEPKRRDKEVAKREAKERVSERKESNDTIATPAAKDAVLPPVPVPGLSKSASATTIVHLSGSAINFEFSPSYKALHLGEPSGCSYVPRSPSGAQRSLSSPSSETVKTPRSTTKTKPHKKKKKKGKVVSPPIALFPVSDALQCQTVVAEKVSEQDSSSEVYDAAVNFITSYLADPSARHGRTCHLALLQSLIIEFGLQSDRKLLPQSIKSAKKFIKAHVFINIREYLMRRHEGHAVVKGLMHHSRSALVRDLKWKKNTVSPAWAKEIGLRDLLVSAFHCH